MKIVGVVFSGCGVLDGIEIYEFVLIILVLDCVGVCIVFFVLDKL